MPTGLKINLQVSYVNDWLKVEIPVDAFSIVGARVTFKTDQSSSVYLDRFEMKAKSYNTNKLTLEKLTTSLNRDYALNKAEFGETFDSLQDTIKESVKDGDIALSIVTKQ